MKKSIKKFLALSHNVLRYVKLVGRTKKENIYSPQKEHPLRKSVKDLISCVLLQNQS